MSTFDDGMQGSDYETMIHKMTEVLQAPIWSYDVIFQVTNQQLVELKERDIQTLLQPGKDSDYLLVYGGDVHCEMPFMVGNGLRILHDYMDFVSIQNDRMIILDSKIDSLEEDAEFIQRHRGQLTMYKKTMHILYPKRSITTCVYSLHLHRVTTIS